MNKTVIITFAGGFICLFLMLLVIGIQAYNDVYYFILNIPLTTYMASFSATSWLVGFIYLLYEGGYFEQ